MIFNFKADIEMSDNFETILVWLKPHTLLIILTKNKIKILVINSRLLQVTKMYVQNANTNMKIQI